jgi:hypothetical protein
MTSVEVVLLFIRDEWRYQLLLCELFPWKVLQPWMFLDLVAATPTQPEHWLALDKFIHEVSSLH